MAGPALAAEAAPVSERDGMVTVACESAVWAQELELLAPTCSTRLNEALGARRGARAVARLRFVVGSAPNRRLSKRDGGPGVAPSRSFCAICRHFVTLESRPARGVAC